MLSAMLAKPFGVECSSFAFATARQVSACHAEAFGVGGLDVLFQNQRKRSTFNAQHSTFNAAWPACSHHEKFMRFKPNVNRGGIDRFGFDSENAETQRRRAVSCIAG